MPFRPPRKLPKFADLKTILSQSKNTDDPLYQVIQEIIERLSTFQFQVEPGTIVVDSGGGGGGGGATEFATYLTRQDETAALPNSLQLLARYGLKFDNAVANKQTIDLDLEYLGNFAAGPLYSDGDVVVAADGIAYLCVKPTSAAPVPWPGVGISTVVGPPGPTGPQGPPGPPDPTIPAMYWVVAPYPGLVNARALNGLGNGYVKSTAGEPSVVPNIPLTDTTGILPDNRLTSNVALKNIDNNFVAQTLASYSVILGNNSALYFNESSATADNHIWRLISYGGTNGNRYMEALNDAQSVIQAQFAFGRDNRFYAGSFSGIGDGLTSLNASQLTTGIVNPARLGSGTANSSTVLYGDSVYRVPPTGDVFPSGLIVISDTPCPVGWTRVNWDGFFIRSGPTIGVSGGSATHSHTQGSLHTESHDHGGRTGTVTISGTTSNDGNHGHSVTVDGNGSTGDGQGSVQTADAGGSFQTLTPPHHHDFSVHSTGSTNAAGAHTHSFSGSDTGTIPNEGDLNVFGTTDAASNLPPYIDVYFCRKN